MTPPHVHQVEQLSDSGGREAWDGGEHVTRDAMKLAILRHKDDCDLRDKVDKLRLWVAGATALGMFFNGMGLVVLAWWLSTRYPGQHRASAESPSLINQAHASEKGTP